MLKSDLILQFLGEDLLSVGVLGGGWGGGRGQADP